ncbi:MAG TPA: hypothetical protein VH678_32310 [Xanthobacteraceae bacterium]|jgi:hypothetical protein
MAWIEALKYGLTALAALFGIWSALKLKAEVKSPGDRGARLLDRFMIFCVLLLVLSGLLAVYDGYVLQEKRRTTEMAPVLARMDQTVGDKLDIANDAFAPMDSLSKQSLDNILRQLCQDVIELAKVTAAPTPRCGARLKRAPFEAPT